MAACAATACQSVRIRRLVPDWDSTVGETVYHMGGHAKCDVEYDLIWFTK